MSTYTKSQHRELPPTSVHEVAIKDATVAPVRDQGIASSAGTVDAPRWLTPLSLFMADLLIIAALASGAVYLLTAYAGATLAAGYRAVGYGIPALLGGYAIGGLYGVRAIHPAEEMRHMASMTLLVAGGAALALLAVTPPTALAVGVAGGAVALFAPMGRTLARVLLARTEWWGCPVIVIGEQSFGHKVIDTLQRWPEIGLRPVALLSEDVQDTSYKGVPQSRQLSQAPVLATEQGIGGAVMAAPSRSHRARPQLVERYGKYFDRLFVCSQSWGGVALWTSRSLASGLFAQEVCPYGQGQGASKIKRIIDVLGALAGMVVMAPFFLTAVFLVKLDSEGPVFFRQERMGQDGGCFTIYKFRTMHCDAKQRLQEILERDPERRKEYERYHKLSEDPRVTRLGRWLRRLSLDELPQLWNVLRGDMSLVGPRAYMPSELHKMNGLSRPVLQGPPGLTGLWQVSGRNHLDFETRVDLDVHYAQNWNVWLDLYILIRTIPVVLTGEGAN